ncbi:MAG: cellulase family glycosylhydrolase [Chloroflexota bacterium]|nr:cellulase family glycosylhydrolase [Chloroflexota bacterium]
MSRQKKKPSLAGIVISAAGLLLVGGLAVFALLGTPALAHAPPGQWLFNLTGEEAPLSQIKGLSDLVADAMRPRLETEDMVPVAHAGVNPFGVNVFLEQEVDPAKREQAVRMAQEAGFHWLRQEFPWEDIEIHGKGDFEDRRNEPVRSAWEKYDHIVDLAEAYDMELIARLSNPPAWSRSAGNDGGTYAPPDDLADYGDFVAAVVDRYQGRVRYYQLWNEPNIYPEWGDSAIDPEGFTELLKTGATRARAIDPEVVIISGALASTIDLDGIHVPARNFNDLTFLQRMYDAGAAPYFDVLAMQGYGLWSGPTDQRTQPRVINFGRPQLVRDVMVKNGDAQKPIWISEMNWNAVPNDIPDKRYGQVTEEQQARYLPLAYDRIQTEWPWVGVANTWYLKRPTDQWEQNGQPEAYFRLLTPGFDPLPVYDSMMDFTDDLRPALHQGYHQEDHWAINYTGNWDTIADDQAVLSQLRQTSDPAAGLSFRFVGSDLELVAPRGPGMGRWIVEVDGRERARINLDSSSPRPALSATVARSLSSISAHQVTIRPELDESGQLVGPVALDGIVVRRRNMAFVNGLYCLVTLLFLAVLGLLGYFWLASRHNIPQQAGWQE